MVRDIASRVVLTAALAGVLAACSSEAASDAPLGSAAAANVAAEPAVIKQRQDNFKAIAGAFRAVRGELEKDAPDFTLIAAKASVINTRAKLIKGYFPAGSGVDAGHDTEALASIWEKPEKFTAAAKKLVDQSAKLAVIAGEGNKAAVGAQTMAMGGACKGCHDQFRLADE